MFAFNICTKYKITKALNAAFLGMNVNRFKEQMITSLPKSVEIH